MGRAGGIVEGPGRVGGAGSWGGWVGGSAWVPWRPTQAQADAAWPCGGPGGWQDCCLSAALRDSRREGPACGGWPRLSRRRCVLAGEGSSVCQSRISVPALWPWPLQSCTHLPVAAAFLPWALRVCGQLPVSAAMSMRQASSVVMGRGAGVECGAVEVSGEFL